MNNIAIRVNNLSKCYHIYDRPQDRLKQSIVPRLRSLVGRNPGCYFREFWALNDVSFEVGRGETIGIIGRNGSGKSTLLQMICGTLEPTTGSVVTNGRVAALLELGAGFNPEFTGRENVYMNATVLGLTQDEIEARFEDIAAFADIGDFIEQPVKHYSSGMYARLAFAVAINVDPSILIVDEALAVGDEPFQRKCFARLQSIQEGGGTILFVSHAATSVVQLCTSAILMDSGELLLAHTPKVVISKYQKLIYADSDKVLGLKSDIRGLNKLTKQESEPDLQDTKLKNTNGDVPPEEFTPKIQEYYDEFYDPGMIPSNTVRYPSRGAEIINPRMETLNGNVVNHLIGRQDYIYT